MADCVHCGAQIDDDHRYCPQCGRRRNDDARVDTKVMEVPADETGRVPITRTHAEPQFYGVTPRSLVLALAAAAIAAAAVLLVIGEWPFALVAVGVGILLVAAFLGGGRRTQTASTSPIAAAAVGDIRARATVAAESFATRGRAARRLVALRRELRRMGSLRRQLLFDYGDAVYRGDAHVAETVRARIDELDRVASETEGEMHAIVEATHRRIEYARLEVQPTQVAQAPNVPEPQTPGEGNPPEPARIPEQYPPPDEGTPPQPAVIPEPGPAVIPEPGPRGAGGEAG